MTYELRLWEKKTPYSPNSVKIANLKISTKDSTVSNFKFCRTKEDPLLYLLQFWKEIETFDLLHLAYVTNSPATTSPNHFKYNPQKSQPKKRCRRCAPSQPPKDAYIQSRSRLALRSCTLSPRDCMYIAGIRRERARTCGE